MFDVTLLPVMRRDGKETADAFSFYLAEAPRRAARGRSGDRLILYLCLKGNAPIPLERQKQMLAHLASVFFKTPGSVTAALRTVATTLNQHLLERNQQMARSGQQILGLLAQVVLRGEHLYLAYSGPITTFWSSPEESRMVEDVEMLGRGLGLGRHAPISFLHYELKAGGAVLLAAEASPTWSASTLTGIHQWNAEALRRKLFGTHAPNLSALLVVARQGEGKYFLMRPKIDASRPATDALASQSEAGEIEPQPSAQKEIEGESLDGTGKEALGRASAPSTGGVIPPPSVPLGAERFATPLPHTTRRRSSTSRLSPFASFFLSLGQSLFGVLRKVGLGVLTGLEKAFPESALEQIPTRLMIALALIIPILVVTASSLAYFRMGRSVQYQLYLEQAQKIAEEAALQSDLNVQRQEWRTVLDLIQQAETYNVTPDTQHLKALANGVLDQLDLIKRVNYQEAIEGGLPLSVRVRAMVAAKEELYLLDESSGVVLRARKTSRGSYEVDTSFRCSMEDAGGIIPLVDIAPWPAGYAPHPEATIVAVDALGHLLFCQPGSLPIAEDLPPPMTAEWSRVNALSLDLGNMFLLDPSSGVWIFWARQFDQPPKFFFSGEVPPLENVIDMLVVSNELYLLDTDGQLTLCALSLVDSAPTRCTKGVYLDNRPGYESLPMAIQPGFVQVVYVPPPDASLLLVQAESHAIFHFSLRSLVYQTQYLPLTSLVEYPITAASVDPSARLIFIALGNRIYYAVLP